jgi:hypothetical protein
MIKLVASDVDGTLVDGQGKLHPETFDVIQKMHKKDVRFVVASGRQYQSLRNKFAPIADEIAYIAENGAVVVLDGKEIHKSVIEAKLIPEFIQDVRKIKNTHLVLCSKDCAYIETDNLAVLKEMQIYYANLEIVEDLTKVDAEIIKLSVMHMEDSELTYAGLEAKWSQHLTIVITTPLWVDVYNQSTSKGFALKKLQEHYGANFDNTMVFGDYFNDVSMMKEAKYSYAMANAPAGVKDEATYEAASNEQYGVLQVIYDRILG